MLPPAAELAVLEALWEGSPRTARELARTLYGDDAASPTATVQTLLGRLERRGCVRRDRSERTHRFTPAASREAFAGAELAGLAERLSAGSLAPLVSHLIDAGRLSESDLAALRAKLDEHVAARGGA